MSQNSGDDFGARAWCAPGSRGAARTCAECLEVDHCGAAVGSGAGGKRLGRPPALDERGQGSRAAAARVPPLKLEGAGDVGHDFQDATASTAGSTLSRGEAVGPKMRHSTRPCSGPEAGRDPPAQRDTRWQPGESGNPNGRPRGAEASLSILLRARVSC